MDDNHFKTLYEQHKQDSDEVLRKIADNPSKYSAEAVYACRKILFERHGNTKQESQTVYKADEKSMTLENIDRNLATIRNIMIFWTVLGILGVIATVFSSCS
jgi:hypothetical protein